MTRFSDTLLEHARRPHNFGRDSGAALAGRANFLGRPPSIEIYLQVENEKVRRAMFWAEGCGVSIAVGSMLTDLISGQQIDHCLMLSEEEISTNLDGVPPDKWFCVEVGIAALKCALASAASPLLGG